MVKIHYFFDPMCGWCYGASALIQRLAESSKVELIYHPGGMITRRSLDSALRGYIVEADAQIEKQTKVEFGDAYKMRLVSEQEFILDSYVTAQAFLAGQAMGVAAFSMLSSIQRGHYLHGLQLENTEVLKKLAMSMGLDGEVWEVNMSRLKSEVLVEIDNTRTLMQRWGVSGYPTLVSETDKGPMKLSISEYYGDVPKWNNFIDSSL